MGDRDDHFLMPLFDGSRQFRTSSAGQKCGLLVFIEAGVVKLCVDLIESQQILFQQRGLGPPQLRDLLLAVLAKRRNILRQAGDFSRLSDVIDDCDGQAEGQEYKSQRLRADVR
jgi:hypothetical protein